MDTITFFDSRAKFEVKENENNIFVLIFLQKGHFFLKGIAIAPNAPPLLPYCMHR